MGTSASIFLTEDLNDVYCKSIEELHHIVNKYDIDNEPKCNIIHDVDKLLSSDKYRGNRDIESDEKFIRDSMIKENIEIIEDLISEIINLIIRTNNSYKWILTNYYN